jgi:hypothetical protein
MISFKQFVLEARDNVTKEWESSDVSEEDAIAWLKENNLDSIKMNRYIYRGFSGGRALGEMRMIDSTNGRRKSRDTDGFYQKMMDTSEAMKNVPSRSNSFICTNDQITAEAYGKCMYVFPKKVTQLIACDENDFIEVSAPPKFYKSGACGMNSTFASGATMLGIRAADLLETYIGTLYDRDLDSEFKKLRIPYEKILDKLKIDRTNARTEILDNSGKGLFTAICTYCVDPEGLGLEEISYSDILPNKDAELWFSGKALIMDMTTFKLLRQDGKI